MSDIVKVDSAAMAYVPRNHDHAWRQAEIIAASRLYGLSGPEQAYVVLMTGADLGLSQSQALRGVKIIDGQPSPSADTLQAVCMVSHACEYFREIETTSEQSTWETKRRGNPPVRSTFTLGQAKAAGLLDRGPKSNWAKYPERMLKARAKAYLARDVYPDLTLGLYTPEELNSEDAVTVTVEPQIPDTPIEVVPTEIVDDWQSRVRAAYVEHGRSYALQIAKDHAASSPEHRDEAIALIGDLDKESK